MEEGSVTFRLTAGDSAAQGVATQPKCFEIRLDGPSPLRSGSLSPALLRLNSEDLDEGVLSVAQSIRPTQSECHRITQLSSDSASAPKDSELDIGLFNKYSALEKENAELREQFMVLCPSLKTELSALKDLMNSIKDKESSVEEQLDRTNQNLCALQQELRRHSATLWNKQSAAPNSEAPYTLHNELVALEREKQQLQQQLSALPRCSRSVATQRQRQSLELERSIVDSRLESLQNKLKKQSTTSYC